MAGFLPQTSPSAAHSNAELVFEGLDWWCRVLQHPVPRILTNLHPHLVLTGQIGKFLVFKGSHSERPVLAWPTWGAPSLPLSMDRIKMFQDTLRCLPRDDRGSNTREREENTSQASLLENLEQKSQDEFSLFFIYLSTSKV